MSITTLKTRSIGGDAFPFDFNWDCPVCGYENRAFQLPIKEEGKAGLYTRTELTEACQQCQHAKREGGEA